MMNNTELGHFTGRTIEVLISCTDLADLDDFTKSDPMCVLFYKQYGQWKEVGRTEAIRNTLNPKFVETFLLEYDPVFQHNLMFSLYDIDNSSSDLRRHDFVGSVETTLSDLLDPRKDICTVCKTLRVAGTSKARGIISITSEVVKESRDKVSLHVGGHRLNKSGKIIMSKPDVYLEISRSIDNVEFHPVFRTETIRKTQHPRWRPLEISLQRICNGDWDRLIEFAVWHHSGSGDYKMLGRKVTTLRELKMLKTQGHYQEMSLVPRKKKKSKQSIKITNCGTLRFFQIRIDCQYSLIEFVQGGMNLNLIIGIDFTASNGKVGESHCLHDASSKSDNEYIQVLDSLCAIIANCNPTQRMTMLGFGAKTDHTEQVRNCFPLSNDWDNISVDGVTGAIKLYKKAVKKLRFSGPSRLKPMLAMAESMSIREPTQDKQVYNVLVIITDGIINDIDDVIQRLISISHLPLSVIFVGVGPADFSLMESFSYHNYGVLSCKTLNMKSSRKHTHFVSFRRESENSVGNDILAGDTFAILSSQVLEYMRTKDIVPNRPSIQKSQSSISLDRYNHRKLEPTRSGSTISRHGSQKNLNKRTSTLSSDPKCPTCGSVIDLRPTKHDLISVGSFIQCDT